MIGGNDVTLKTAGPQETMEAFVRMIQHAWPEARYEDAETGEKYCRMVEIPFGQVKELLVYHDADAEQRWDAGQDAPENSMLALVRRDQDVTLVCDAPQKGTIPRIMEGVRGLIRSMRGAWS